MWVPREDKDPILPHAPTRNSVAVFGAVSVADGRLVTRKERTFNGMSFLSFMGQLLRHRRRNRRMVLVLDNARYHHAEAFAPWLKEHRHVLGLDFLPPYSPELNGLERVWKLTRRLATHNRYFPVLDELLQAVSRQFDLWVNPNETLRRLCAIT